MDIKFKAKQFLKGRVQNMILPGEYRKAVKKTAINPKRVIFADAHNDHLPESMQAVYDRVKGMGYDVKICCKDIGKMSHVDAVQFMKEFMWEYAAAKTVFISSYFLPVSSCKKREGTTVIQMWHSGGLLKKMAYDTTDDIPEGYTGEVTRNYDKVTVSAPICAPVWESAMHLAPGTAEATGLSRTDRYFDEEWNRKCREIFFQKYPEARGKKIVLYAPSFSGNAAHPRCAGIDAGVRDTFAKCSDEYFFAVSLHPRLKRRYPSIGINLPSSEVLPVADLLITDYSSILFDYSIYRKPFVLFCPDLKVYRESRGFYKDPDSFPGDVIRDTDQLEEYLKTKGWRDEQSPETLEEFYQTYMGKCDGHATDRVLALAKLNSLK